MATVGMGASVGVAGCLGGGDGDGLSGEVRISGSSTVFPVSEAAAEEFLREHPNADISVSADGTTGGFQQQFIPGNSDINGASRPILDEELAAIQENGFDVIELQCASDAITAVVHNENDWVDCMDLETLGRIWDPDAENELWSDIDPDWPEEPFELYGPATTSGTFDWWTENVIGKFRQIRDDFEGTEEDDLIAQGVAGNPYTHGYLPFSYYKNNPDTVKALEIDAGDGCTPPSLEAASDGSYPLARPIYWYVNTEKLRQKPTLQEFIKFAVEMSGESSIMADDIGYVPMNDTEVQNNLDKIDEVLSE